MRVDCVYTKDGDEVSYIYMKIYDCVKEINCITVFSVKLHDYGKITGLY